MIRFVGLSILLVTLLLFDQNYSFAITLHVSAETDFLIRTRSHGSPSSARSKPSPQVSNSHQGRISVHYTRQGRQSIGLARFDLSPLPPGAPIQNAQLRIWVSSLRHDGVLQFHDILDHWEEDHLEEPHVPPIGPVFQSTLISQSDVQTFLTVDLTSLVQDWIDHPSSNFGVALVSDDVNPLHVEFDSKENRRTSHPMEIEVTLAVGSGPIGPQGPPGPQGMIGPPGQDGPPGLDGTPGRDGSPGQDGSHWLTGVEPPTSEQGTIGDFYLETGTGHYFQKTEASTWILIGSLVGPQGSQGLQGPRGEQGLMGIPGPPGPVLLLGQSCSPLEFVSGFDSLGNILCTPLPSTAPPGSPPVQGVNPGDIIITEFMADPASVGDTNGEWFEVVNVGSEAVDISGWSIQEATGNSHTISSNAPLFIPAQGFLVFGLNADTATNGGIPVNYQYNGLSLNNGGDSITLIDESGETIDQVVYTNTDFSISPGISLNLDPAHFNGIDNDQSTFWCLSTTAIGPDLDIGTPGAANTACP